MDVQYLANKAKIYSDKVFSALRPVIENAYVNGYVDGYEDKDASADRKPVCAHSVDSGKKHAADQPAGRDMAGTK